ncbi:MAG: GNAT family N-acetyltransferase, partial [Gaiellales bacterium]
SRWGTIHTGAPLTPSLGPLLPSPGERKHARTREIKLVEALLEALGPFAHLDARGHPSFDYWAPLRWHGFEQTTHYTWRIGRGPTAEGVAAGFRDNIRGDIRKARKRGVAVSSATLEEFLEVHSHTTARAGLDRSAEASRQALARIDPAAARRDARTIVAARGADGQIHAAGYFVRDERSVYYLAGGSNSELRSSGATSLLLSTAIEQAMDSGLAFDFEGSMLRPIERFFRAFGGTPTPYSIVRRTPSAALRTERALKRAGRGLARR